MGAPGAFKVDEWKAMIKDEIKIVESLKSKYERLVQNQQVTVEFHASDQTSGIGENACKAAKVYCAFNWMNKKFRLNISRRKRTETQSLRFFQAVVPILKST